MENETVNLVGSTGIFSPEQLMIVIGFLGIVVGFILAMIFNRRRKLATDMAGAEAQALREKATSNMAFMNGINYILADNPDRAIQELTQAINVDTETVEIYVALGSLFRKQGDIDKAVRIRQSIIVRPKIDESIRLQAKYDLGLDYLAGGFFDRAVNTFTEVLEKNPKHAEAQLQLVKIYEQTRDWNKAFAAREKLDRLTGVRTTNVLAHYMVEMGKQQMENGEKSKAKSSYKKAMTLDPACVDAYLHMGDFHQREGKYKKALDAWRKIMDVAPQFAFLTFARLAGISARMKDPAPVEDYLIQCAASQSNPLAHLALARLLAQRGENDRAILELTKALDLEPNLIEAHREMGLLLLALGRNDEAIDAYKSLLSHLTPPLPAFECHQCGFESQDLTWCCPKCSAWDSMALCRHTPVLFGKEGPVTKELVLAEPVDETDMAEDA